MPISTRKVWIPLCECGKEIAIHTRWDSKLQRGKCLGCGKEFPWGFSVDMTPQFEAAIEDLSGNLICSVTGATEKEAIRKVEELQKKLEEADCYGDW
jgi:hypothetical protein